MERGIVGEEPLWVESDQSVWTLFVHNIEDRLHWKGVWQVFDRHGVVVDVFIPRRRSRAGRRFGFVRMASKEDTDRVIERLNGFWLYGARVSVSLAIRGANKVSPTHRRSRSAATRGGMDHQAGSRESVNGEHGEEYRRVDGIEDVLKKEVLTTCAVAWCKGSLRGMELLADLKREGFTGFSMMRISGAAYLLMFTNEEDMRDLISRPAIKQWFTKIEGWKPGVQIRSRSVWLSMVGIPIHLWSEDTFCNIAQVWGSLIRVEDATAEPQNFECARFLIETSCVDRIEEMLKLFWGEESYRIRIQKVEVVHSHDLMCNCADSDTVVSSEDKQEVVDKIQLVRDNPTFAPVMLPSHVDVGGDVNCDEWSGLVDRNIEVIADHVDVLWEAQPELEPPEWTSVKIRGETVFSKMEQLRGETFSENQEQLLALEWVTQLGNDGEFFSFTIEIKRGICALYNCIKLF
ncbi:hypothetical protein GQ457_09G019190 [Hibiscus cannabinus]